MPFPFATIMQISTVGDRELDAFIAAVEQQSLYTQPSDLKIVYTPLHGTGNVPVRRVLRNMHVSVVKSQELPDGNFSTVRSPNPEEKDALTLAIAQAKAEGADLVLGTDQTVTVWALRCVTATIMCCLPAIRPARCWCSLY